MDIVSAVAEVDSAWCLHCADREGDSSCRRGCRAPCAWYVAVVYFTGDD